MNRLRQQLTARTTALTAALITALTGLILQGCQQLQRRSTLFIYLVPPSDAAEVVSRKQLDKLWAPAIDAYR